jgi:putative DNA primase/helicase
MTRDLTDWLYLLAATYFKPAPPLKSTDLTDVAVWPDVGGVEGVKKRKPRFAALLNGERLLNDASSQDLEFVCYALEAHRGNGQATLEWLESDHGYQFSAKKADRMDYYLPRTILRAFDRLSGDPVINVKFGGLLPAGASLARLPPTPEPLPDMLPAAVPQALYRYTDQANAERLQIMYRSWLISVAGDFYAWDGKRWKLDDGLAQRFACDLSRLVNQERNEVATQLKALQASGAEGIGDKFVQLEAEVKALTGWAAKCENVATQNAALHLLRKLLNVPVEKIDASPWLLNVENGTIDLRTGVLSAHDPANLITKLAPMSYDPTATAPRFKKFLGEIVQGDTEVVNFMQRWYGYAATGDAREQKLLIKHGPGGNGKSTLGDAIDSVLGEYTSPATLGLLTGKAGASDTAHLAEIADLRGRRLVTASESEDGAKLKEALLKQLTGGDTLKGKRLYGQLFSFRPTHKLELLTNHKPVIKGSDFSIWRRIMLLNFPVKFGTAAEVARGDAMAVRDPTLPAALKAEGSGILAWVVEGTRLWLANGLAPPKAVLDASAEYRQSQDHVAEFLAESCTLDPEAKQPLPALYQAYKAWCHAAGRDYPVTRQRLVDELERRVPRFLRPDPSRRTAQGSYVMGLKLASED